MEHVMSISSMSSKQIIWSFVMWSLPSPSRKYNPLPRVERIHFFLLLSSIVRNQLLLCIRWTALTLWISNVGFSNGSYRWSIALNALFLVLMRRASSLWWQASWPTNWSVVWMYWMCWTWKYNHRRSFPKRSNSPRTNILWDDFLTWAAWIYLDFARCAHLYRVKSMMKHTRTYLHRWRSGIHSWQLYGLEGKDRKVSCMQI